MNEPTVKEMLGRIKNDLDNISRDLAHLNVHLTPTGCAVVPEAQDRPLPWRVINLKNMKSVAVCDANGVTLFEDRGFANESEKEFSAARISEMVASHNTLAKLKPAVEELLRAIDRGCSWQSVKRGYARWVEKYGFAEIEWRDHEP